MGSVPPIDYRLSHQLPEKAEQYHAKFSMNPHRAVMWSLEQAALHRILDDTFGSNRVRHLDFACGTGRILEAVASRTSLSVGIDVSRAMLDVARRVSPQSVLVEGDLTRGADIGAGQFDLITAFRFFPNAQADLRQEAIQALTRYLAPSGILVFNNHMNRFSLRFRLARILRRKVLAGMAHDEVLDLVQSADLKIIRRMHAGVLPATEGHLLLPKPVFTFLERCLSGYSVLGPLAQDLIYVCGRKAS